MSRLDKGDKPCKGEKAYKGEKVKKWKGEKMANANKAFGLTP